MLKPLFIRMHESRKFRTKKKNTTTQCVLKLTKTQPTITPNGKAVMKLAEGFLPFSGAPRS